MRTESELKELYLELMKWIFDVNWKKRKKRKKRKAVEVQK